MMSSSSGLLSATGNETTVNGGLWSVLRILLGERKKKNFFLKFQMATQLNRQEEKKKQYKQDKQSIL